MPRAIWKGHIAFGLVNIPVSLYSAENNTDLDFDLLDSRDKARIRYQRVNDVSGEEVAWDQIVKGFEFDEDQYVLLSEEDFKKASPEATQTVEIETFVPRDSIDDIYFDKPYYLVPRGKGAKSYVLMRNTLKERNRVGIARVVIRTREYLAALLPEGNALFLILMRYQQEIRSQDEFDFPDKEPSDYDITEKEEKLAGQLVESMAEEWNPSQYHDEYREALLKWIETKVEEGEIEATPSAEAPEGEEPGTAPIDVTELLQRSVEKASA